MEGLRFFGYTVSQLCGYGIALSSGLCALWSLALMGATALAWLLAERMGR